MSRAPISSSEKLAAVPMKVPKAEKKPSSSPTFGALSAGLLLASAIRRVTTTYTINVPRLGMIEPSRDAVASLASRAFSRFTTVWNCSPHQRAARVSAPASRSLDTAFSSSRLRLCAWASATSWWRWSGLD